MEPDRRRALRLLRGFDRAFSRMQGYLDARYGPARARNLVAGARQEFAHLLPDLPDLQGRQPFTLFITTTGWALAFYRALPESREAVREAGEFAYALTASYVRSLPRFVARVIEWVWFSKPFRRRVSRRAKQSQMRRQRGDFVYEYVEGEAQRYDYGVDYLECAVLTFLQSQGAPELAPYICALDQASGEALGWGLIRTNTLAEGGGRCDFRFKRGGKTRIDSTVLPISE